MNDLITKEFNSNTIRITFINDEPWWVAKDVCEILELSHVHNAVSKLDEDERLNVKVLQSGQNRQMLAISESGIYTLILRSNKPEAKEFKRWITHKVLPEIRKTGSYLPENGMIQVMDKMLNFIEKRFELLEQKINRTLQNDSEYIEPIDPVPEMTYRAKLNHHIRTYGKKHNYKGYQYESAWNNLYLHFYYRYKTDVRRIAENQQKKGQPLKPLDVIEDKNLMREAYNLAVMLFPLPKYALAI